MTNIPGIQQSSGFTLNRALPVDLKMRLSTADRLALDEQQRREGMIVYDTDLKSWKTLINLNTGNSTTSESDWVDFLPTMLGATEVTYNELRDLMDNNNLVPGYWYKITDYQSKNDTGNLDNFVVYTGPIAPVIVQAISTNTVSKYAFQEGFFNETILYDVYDDTIGIEGYAVWEDGSDDGEVVTISNVQPHSFEINNNFVLDENFYLYIEDDNNDYEYYASDEGTKYTITDIGGGQYRVDLIDTANDPIDLTDPNHNYIEMGETIVGETRPGYIIYRKNYEHNIEGNFDWRECKKVRYRIDTTQLSTYDNSATYNTNSQLVYYNNSVYICKSPKDITGIHPTDSRYWGLFIRNADTAYLFSPYFNYFQSKDVHLDMANPVYHYVLGEKDGTGAGGFSLEGKRNIKLYNDDTVLLTDIAQDCLFDNRSYGMTFMTSLYNVKLINSSRIVGDDSSSITNPHGEWSMRYCVFQGGTTNSKIDYLTNSLLQGLNGVDIGNGNSYFIFYNVSNCDIGKGINHLWFTNTNYTNVGDQCARIYIMSAYKVDFGAGNHDMRFYTNTFRNFKRGKENRFFRFDSGAWLERSTIGDQNGHWSIWFEGGNMTIRDTIIGNMNFSDGNTSINYIYSSRIGNFNKKLHMNSMSYSTMGEQNHDYDIGMYVSYCDIASNTGNITTYGLASCVLEGTNNNIDSSVIGTIPIRNTTFKKEAGYITLTNTQAVLTKAYSKDVYRTKNGNSIGNMKVLYIDEPTNSVVIADPDDNG